MPNLGGTMPYPRRFGGGKTNVQLSMASLAQDRGTAYDSLTSSTVVYAENMAIARAIAAGWSTNGRLSHMWDPSRCDEGTLGRWEKILSQIPAPSDTPADRRARVGEVMSRFGEATIAAQVTARLTAVLGSVFVALEHISLANANITVPDGSYPWGTVTSGGNPWSSTVKHFLIRTTKPTGWTEGAYYDAIALIGPLLDPILPADTTYDWYRSGTSPVNVSGGPSGGSFRIDDTHNLDEEVFDV